MAIQRTPMTRPGYERLRDELDRLKRVDRHAITKAIAEARAHGDLSENAEYEAAKHRQDFVRSRIGQIEGRIRELSMYTVASIPRDVVAYGSRVKLADVDADTDELIAYQIVFPEEVDAARGQISLSSPIGRALMSKRVGDEVEVQTPSGRRTYQIMELVTFHELGERGDGGRG
jgi:transcription elongation factor GreA